MACRFCGARVTELGQNQCRFCTALPPVSGDSVIELLRQIDQRFDQAEQTLHAQRRKDPIHGIVGWYHHLDRSDKVGISSTAYALHALSLLSPRDPDLISVAEGILDHPNRLDIGAAGDRSRNLFAWPMQSRPDVPLVEPTCYVLQQLLEAGLLRRDDPRAVGALEWILTQQLYEHGWGPSSEHPPSVYVTALVCQVLRAFRYGRGQAKLDAALKWLFGARNDDGGWGKKHRDGESNAWCTSHALMALHDGSLISSEPNSVPGVAWLRSRTGTWSSLLADEYVVTSLTLGRVEVRYEFQALPLVLIALDHAGIRPLAPDIFQAIEELLKHERDGVWIWPSSSRKTIFNLSHSVQAMRAVRERFNNAESLRAMLDLKPTIAIATSIGEQSVTLSPTVPGLSDPPRDRWRKYGVLGIGLAALLMLVVAITPPSGVETITAVLRTGIAEAMKSPVWLTAALSALGAAAAIRWQWKGRWMALYAGAMMTLFLFLKQGEVGVWSVLGSVAATLVLLFLTEGRHGRSSGA